MTSLKSKLVFAAAGMLVVVTLADYVTSLPDKYREEGRVQVRADLERQSDLLNVRRDEQIETAKKENARLLREAKSYYETEISKRDERYRLARADGLRWKSAANSSEAAKGTTAASCPVAVDGAGENRLPEHIENGIFDAFEEADRIAAKLAALQAIVRNSRCHVVEARTTREGER